MDFSGIDDFPPSSEVETRGARFLLISGHDIAVDQNAQFFTRYLVKVLLPSGKTHVIPRRYRQFRALHEAIRALPAIERPARHELPGITSKKWGGANTPELIDKRTRKLQDYLLAVSSIALLFPSVDRELQAFFSATQDDAPDGVPDDEDAGLVDVTASSDKPGTADPPSAQPPPPPSRSSLPPTATRASLTSVARSSMTAVAQGSAISTRSSLVAAEPGAGAPSLGSQGRCCACDKDLSSAVPVVAASPASCTWDTARFCSPQCERFFSAAMHKGFTITAIAGKRQIANVPAAGDVEAGGLEPASNAHHRLGALRSGASTWWGSARKVLVGGSPTAPPSAASTPRGSASGSALDGEARRSSTADDEGGGRKDGTNSHGSSVLGAGASSGEEAEGGGGSSRLGRDESIDEHHKFFLDRRKRRDSARVLTKWGSLGSLVSSRSGVTVAKSARDSDPPAPPPPPLSSKPAAPQAPPRRSPTTGPVPAVQLMPAEVLHYKGFLWKRGGFKGGRKSWKWRYFELRDRTLYYYGTTRSVLLGTMSLIKEPTTGSLLAAAATLQAHGMASSGADFAHALFTQLTATDHAYFAAIQVPQGET